MEKVSERAIAYREAKKTLGTVKAVADHYAVSVATVSRYLSLNDDDLAAIDSGEKSIRNDRKRISKSIIPNSGNEIKLMEYAAHCEFFTAIQAGEHLKVGIGIIRNLLETMRTKGLLKKNTEYLPHVFSLTTRGCVLIDKEKPKHYFSAAAIHQRLMRNAVEQSIQRTNNTAIFKSRTYCWQLGLFPSVGEHYLEFITKGKKESALVIIDDYGISPIRLITALRRKHDKDKRYAKGKMVLTWPDLVNRYLVYTTTELQKKNFENFYEYHSDNFLIKPVIRHIQPIWK
jgi:hypothetical protein